MMPLRKIGDTDEKKIHRLTILVEVLMVYIIVVTGIGGYVMLGLIQSNSHRNEDVRQGLGAFVCGAALARENNVIKLPHGPDVADNYRAAQGYLRILTDLQLKDIPVRDLTYGERCPFPSLTRDAKAIVSEWTKHQTP